MTDTSNPPVRYDVADGVATITLARPDAMNALDIPTKEALRVAVQQAAGDPVVRCLLLTGEGRAFSVGQDLNEHAGLLEQGNPVLDTVPRHYNPITHALLTMAKPVVAAVNGVAAGAGAGFAFAADFRVVGESAGFNLAFAGVGLGPDSGTSWTLPRMVGSAKAIELLMRPGTIDSATALDLGLATKVVPDDQVLAEAGALAAELAHGPTMAYAAIRQAVGYSASHEIADSLEREAELQAQCGATEDHRGAVTAFIEKRKPEFHGG
ncbi:MAG: enoyl-CoA hydratase [Streptosporangiales bacterium]|nr:enoyl-CoA hydratase [Streptosporangiales bacterium]